VRLGPGAQAVDVVEALRPHDIQVVSGLCPTVGSSGYVLGGGIGWQTRKFGLGSDRLVAAEVVLADGRVVVCSAEREADLFWALRGGGGGNFGVVTDLKVRSTAVPRIVNFNLTWDWADVEDVLAGYTRWIPDGPDAWGSSLAVVLPDAASGAVPIVTILGGFLDTPERFERALDDLVSSVGRPPLTRDVHDLPYHQAMMQLYGCDNLTVEQCHLVGYNPEALLPRYHFAVDRGRFADRPLSRRGAGDLIAAFDADRRAGQFRYLTFFAMGGQANRADVGATAYPHRNVAYYIGYTVGLNVNTPDPEDRQAAQAWADQGFAVSERLGDGGNYINFPDPHLSDWRRAYYGQNYRRLAQVKRRYDPHNYLQFPQSIGS
jgi:FAD/FMN-containing dehydrogenase